MHSLLILPQTNVSSLADLWLWSRGVICERLCQHHRLPIHVTVYRYVPGRRGARAKKKKWEQRWRWEGRTDGTANERWWGGGSLEEERSGVERRGEEGITQSFLRKGRGMNIPILPCSLETAASSFGGKHCLCLFPAWLFAWCIPQLYIQWWEKDDVLAGWQWGLRGAEAGTVSFIQCKDQRPRFFTPN